MTQSKTFKIAAIPGDGIGKEVLPEGIRVLEAAARKHGLALQFEFFEWASCDYYLAHGKMMPDNWFDQLKGFDALYFGAVGCPDKVPDHISLWGSLLKFRRDFDQYVNIRPVRLFLACPAPGRQAAWRHRLRGGAGKHRRRVLVAGWAHVRRHRQRIRPARIGVHPPWRRPHPRIRLRARTQSLTPACDLGHQVQRHGGEHALLGRAHRRRGRPLPGNHLGQAAHRHPLRTLCAATGALRRGGGLQPVRRHPPTSGRPAPAPSASRRRPTSTPSASFHRCSNRCTARRRTSSARTSPTRSA